ncbi:hypothetical protein IFM89_007260 [Coptis chinensis]|uniref:Disease resistance protein RPM1-like n=1 Tax=Coptis chinensis TaxID=261450 RepID=A0A835IMZ9_9MAGN|nr:hypothetical protein IFM89_007260 [Coptis chinensis]
MADGAIEVLLRKLLSFLEEETSSLGGLRSEFNEMKRELESMKSFLNEADVRGAINQGVRTWVEQVRDVSYDVEDIIDEFMYHLGGQSISKTFIRKTTDSLKNLGMRRRMATKLHDMNVQIKAISERSNRYQYNHVEPTCTRDTREMRQQHAESSLFFKDENLVGIEEDKDILLRWLTDEGESQRAVMSVCGMGGSGKTTLVARTYNNQSVKQHFDCFASVTVTQTYLVQDLFRTLIRDFYQSRKDMVPNGLKSMDYRQLVEILVSYLQTKRYFVILDDVWSINLWREISVSLPEGGRRSRIILTTRNEEIASFSFGVVHHIQPLKEQEAWALFCKTAFSNDSKYCCPKEVAVTARLIVARCQGLPLAIVAMGGIMSTKIKTEGEWRRICKSLNWELNNNPTLEMVKSILLLSYNDLSLSLRQCFLYCSVFPEDYLIKPKRLFRLWIAEGFIVARRGSTLEQVAEMYLMELASRNMIQIAEKNDQERPTICRMHDLMRELALSISERENFSMVYDETVATEVYRARRLLIHKGDSSIPFSVKMPQLRSFFLFVGNMFSASVSNVLPSGFRLLRVLDLQGAPIERLPDELVDLFNLRYLNLRETLVRDLPKSIGRLQNLQTLDVRDTGMKALPKGIVKLQNLRHLATYTLTYEDHFSYSLADAVQVPTDIWKLKNLRILNGILVTTDILKQIGNMTQLTKLGIANVREAHGKLLCTSIQKMKLLHTLSLVLIEGEETLRIDDIVSPPPLLGRINLLGKLEKITIENGATPCLEVLDLISCRQLKMVPQGIEHLTNLQELYLGDISEGLVERLRGEKGVDRPKVQHILEIDHHYQTKKGWFYESLSSFQSKLR